MHRADRIQQSFDNRVARLESACARSESMLAKKQMSVTDCCLIYESAFVNAVASFEAVLQELLCEFVCGRKRARTGNGALIRPTSRDAFEEILFDGRRYRDFLPYKDYAMTIAARHLKGGRPFTQVSDVDKDLLAAAHRIRNAIAHQSGYAIEKFRKSVPGVSGLPANRRVPGALLRYVYKANPSETYQALYLNTFRKVCKIIVTQW